MNKVIKMDINTKCVRIRVTRQVIASFVAGWLPSHKPILRLDKKFKNHCVYYNSDKDVFEIIYYTDDCPEGVVLEDIAPPIFEMMEKAEDETK